jgi:hypothetical protein
MTNLLWVHTLKPNELGIRQGVGLGGGKSFRIPKTADIMNLFPPLTVDNDFTQRISLNLIEDGKVKETFDNLEFTDARKNNPDRVEHKIYLNNMGAYIGLEDSDKIFKPGVTLGFYKNPNGDICFEVIPEGTILENLKLDNTDMLINVLRTNQAKNNTDNLSAIDLYLPKPFLLLAGISGTGKTRFVRKQAEAVDPTRNNYCLVSVRPDWHEPSDLLGYVSRLNEKGSEFIVTDVVKFIVKAWLNSLDSIVVSEIDGKDTFSPLYRSHSDVKPHWLCLDEMNLAPVEQYFADYLSILETRKWASNDSAYTCDALLSANLFSQLEHHGLTKLRKDLGLDGEEFDQTWQYFQQNGICIPFNLIVAGTVNMDETTHGFSRKVIDRALTFDFGEFFPNNYDDFFTPKSQPKTLGFSALSAVNDATELSHVIADDSGAKSIAFLQAVNNVLKGTPFELAFRALNELLVSLHCFAPKDTIELQAVWDDFLMCKVLPRIEGDEDKLAKVDSNILSELDELLTTQLAAIWADDKSRPDLLSEGINDKGVVTTTCRSKKKIEQMQQKLNTAGFTSYWP